MKSILHLSKQAVVLLSAFSCSTDIRVSGTNLPNKGFPPKTVGGGRTGPGLLYEEGTMQEVTVMHAEVGKGTAFFLFPTLYTISGVLASFDFLFGFLLCKRRACREAIRHWKRVVTGSGKHLYKCLHGPVQKNSSGVTCQAVHPSTLETAHHRWKRAESLSGRGRGDCRMRNRYKGESIGFEGFFFSFPNDTYLGN